jgi:hypothetical protein
MLNTFDKIGATNSHLERRYNVLHSYGCTRRDLANAELLILVLSQGGEDNVGPVAAITRNHGS